MKIRLCLLGILLSLCAQIQAQQAEDSFDKLSSFPNKLLGRIKSKAFRLDGQLTRQTEKYLARLARKEKKLQEQLYKTDSNAAKKLSAGTEEKYQRLTQQLKSQTGLSNKPLSGEYLPYVDSLKGALSFLNQNQKLLPANLQSQIGGTFQQFNQLQAKIQQTEQIKAYIRERKQQLKDALGRYTGFGKYLDDYNKEAFYYTSVVRDYKEAINDPDKLTKKALGLLSKTQAFQSFMKNNSQLAGLLGISSDYSTAQGVVGLQTREQVQQLLQSQISAGGSGGMAAFQQNLQTAHQELDQFKDKLAKLGGGSGDMDMPNFKPQTNRTKSFLRRIELGFDLQTSRANYFFPSTVDLGLSAGYKLTNKTTIGAGLAYKIGCGRPLNHIRMSSQGAAVRSYIDVAIKSHFMFSGGLEYNYQPLDNSQQISNLNSWTKSGLAGISKVIPFKGKLVKKTKVSLLWDFLSYYQRPRPADVIKFRVGYVW